MSIRSINKFQKMVFLGLTFLKFYVGPGALRSVLESRDFQNSHS